MPPREPSTTPVLLYDGACGFCARSVQFVLQREPAPRRRALRFAAIEGEFGRSVRSRVAGLAGVDSVVWFDPATGRALVRSEAALAVLHHLGGAWRVLGLVARLVPRGLRDAVYAVIARNRHRIAGETCLVPGAAHRARFLP